MDWNAWIQLSVGIASLLLLLRALTTKPRAWSWVVALGLVLATVCSTARLMPERGAWVSGPAFLLFVLVPALLSRTLTRCVLAQRYESAARLARVLGLLHPSTSFREQPKILRALALLKRGETAEGRAILASRAAGNSPLARAAHIQLLRLEGKWAELLAWLRQRPEHELELDLQCTPFWLRSLGETGDLPGLVDAFRLAAPALDSAAAQTARASCQLFALAFAGRRAAVEVLLESQLSALPEGVRQFWLATAALTAGDSSARSAFESDLAIARDVPRVDVDRRLRQPLASPSSLDEARLRELDAIERAADHETRFGFPRPARAGRPWVVGAILALNLLAFAFEVALGGSTDRQVLTRLGALIPHAVLEEGQWWRLAAASFLHYGPIHLAANLAGILFLGPYLESSLGRARLGLVWLTSAVGAMGVCTLLTSQGWLEDRALVGASGGVMGLVGATVAVMLRGWLRERARVARRHLVLLSALIAVQLALDAITPFVSFATHAAGTVLGFVLATLLRHHTSPRIA